MIVTIVSEVLGEANNGTSIACYNLINHLKKCGHEVRVVCPDVNRKGEPGYYVLPLAHYGKIMDKIFEKNQVVLPSFDEKVIYEACHDADVVHYMIPLFMTKKATEYIVNKLHRPLTAGFHAQAENVSVQFGMLNNELVNHFIYKNDWKSVYCRANAIHYPTQFIRDVFEKHVKHNTPGYVISNGVNKEFKPMEVTRDPKYDGKFCILFTGRLSKEKSHDVLIKAIKYSKYADRIQLFFAGQGPMQTKLEKMGSKLPNPPVIGFYSREDLLKLINSMDLYCHPAKAEIEAISCLEAISCGIVPLIANSKKCATKGFAIDDRSLFKSGNSKDLAKKIDYFIEHPEEKAKLREAYLAESRNFDQDEAMNAMERMLLDVVEASKKKNG